MKKLQFLLLLLVVLQTSFVAAQKVSNIDYRQEQSSIIVSFDLVTIVPCKISLYVSIDGGENWQGPLKKRSPESTAEFKNGSNSIIWNVLEELEELSGNNISFRVIAENLNKTQSLTFYPDENQEDLYHAEIDKLSKIIKLNPKNANAYKARAELKVKLRSDEILSSVISDYSKAIAINIKDASAYKARALHGFNDYGIAIVDINKSILLNPSDSQNFIIKGFIVQKSLEDSNSKNLSYDDVIMDYNKSININPNDGLAYLLRARCKIILNDYKGAIEDIDKSIILGCNDTSLSMNVIWDDYFATCYFERGKVKYILSHKNNSDLLTQSFNDINKYLEIKSSNFFYEVEEIYDETSMLFFLNQYIEVYPKEANTYFKRAILNIKNLNLLNVESDFEIFFTLMKLKNASDEELHLRRYTYLRDSKVFLTLFLNKAVDILQTSNSYFHRATSKSEDKDYSGAIVDFSKAISISPKGSFHYEGRGDAKYELKDYLGAIADYTKAIEQFPDYSYHFEDRGDAKLKINDYRGAIYDFSKAIDLDQKQYSFYRQRGYAKYQLNDYYGSIADYTKAILLSYNFTYVQHEFFHNRGNAKHMVSDYKGAISDYTKAISLNPNEGVYYLNRGNTKIKIKDKIGGCKDLSKAGELGEEKAYESINVNCNK